MYDFASLLFSGPCNARCPFCIGRQLDPRLNTDTLDAYPPPGLEAWIAQVRALAIRQVTCSGTNTDPLLYRHTERLLALLRQELPQAVITLHTNGRLALQKMDEFNRYNRACLSFPSFDPYIYRKMMGVPGVPDLAEILRRSAIPLKLSIVATDDNAAEIGATLEMAASLGVRRVVLRKLDGERRPWGQLLPIQFPPNSYQGRYRQNPVFALYGMEITLWDFRRSTSRCLNLFGNGSINASYRLNEITTPLPAAIPARSPALPLPARPKGNAAPWPLAPA